MKSKKLLLTALVALAVPFGTLSGGFVKAEGPSQPTTPAGTTPSVLSKDVDISTGKEAGGLRIIQLIEQKLNIIN